MQQKSKEGLADPCALGGFLSRCSSFVNGFNSRNLFWALKPSLWEPRTFSPARERGQARPSRGSRSRGIRDPHSRASSGSVTYVFGVFQRKKPNPAIFSLVFQGLGFLPRLPVPSGGARPPREDAPRGHPSAAARAPWGDAAAARALGRPLGASVGATVGPAEVRLLEGLRALTHGPLQGRQALFTPSLSGAFS